MHYICRNLFDCLFKAANPLMKGHYIKVHVDYLFSTAIYHENRTIFFEFSIKVPQSWYVGIDMANLNVNFLSVFSFIANAMEICILGCSMNTMTYYYYCCSCFKNEVQAYAISAYWYTSTFNKMLVFTCAKTEQSCIWSYFEKLQNAHADSLWA